MSKLLYTIVFAVLLMCRGVQGMNLIKFDYSEESAANSFDWRDIERIVQLNWADIADRTSSDAVSMSEMARRRQSGDLSVDWNIMLRDAISGDPAAQYCLAVQYNLDSKLEYNGRKKNLQIASTILVLISAQKGNYAPARLDIEKYMPELPILDFSDRETLLKYVKDFIKVLESW